MKINRKRKMELLNKFMQMSILIIESHETSAANEKRDYAPATLPLVELPFSLNSKTKLADRCLMNN